MIFKYSERDPKELKEIMYVIVVDFSQVILLDALKRRSY